MIFKKKIETQVNKKEVGSIPGEVTLHGVKLFGVTPELTEVEYTVYFRFPRKILRGESIIDLEVKLMTQ